MLRSGVDVLDLVVVVVVWKEGCTRTLLMAWEIVVAGVLSVFWFFRPSSKEISPQQSWSVCVLPGFLELYHTAFLAKFLFSQRLLPNARRRRSWPCSLAHRS